MTIDFSRKGFKKETPLPIVYTYLGIMGVSAIWITVIQPNFISDISEHTQLLITKIVGTVNTGITFLCQFFHWKTQDNNNI